MEQFKTTNIYYCIVSMGQKSHVVGLRASASQKAAIKVSVRNCVLSKALKKKNTLLSSLT